MAFTCRIARRVIGLAALFSLALLASQPPGIVLDPNGKSEIYSVFNTDGWASNTNSALHTGDDRLALDWTRSAGTDGQSVYAAISGELVRYYESTTSYGNTVVIYDVASGFAFRYAHLKDINPALQFITRAVAGITLIGHVGNSGSGRPPSSSNFDPHLHAVLYKGVQRTGRPVDRISLDAANSAFAASYKFVTPPRRQSQSTWHPDGTLLTDGPTVWLVENGKKRGIPSKDLFESSKFNWSQVIQAASQEFGCLEDDSAFGARKLVVSPQGTVYLVTDKGAKRGFPTPFSYLGLGYQWSELPQTRDPSITQMKDDPVYPVMYSPFPDGTLVQQSGEPTVYVITNGKRRGITSPAVLEKLGYSFADVVVLKAEGMESTPESLPAIDENTVTLCHAASESLSSEDLLAQADMRARAARDFRSAVPVPNSLGRNLAWMTVWELRWMDFIDDGLCRMYHALYKPLPFFRYTKYCNPACTDWQLVLP